MARLRNLMVATALTVGSLSIAACGGSVAEQPQTAQSAATKAPVAQNAHGPVKMIGAALGEVALRPEQRTEIEKLAMDAEARHATGSTARKELMEALAAQVDAGKIDRAALQPKIDAIAADMAKNRDADRASFERLHATLDPAQRAAFVDAFQAKMADMKGHHGDHADGDHDKSHARTGGGMKAWADDLKLTDDQKKQIFTAMKDAHKDHAKNKHDHADMKERGAKMMTAFKTDHFVMDEVAPKQDVKAAATKMSDRIIGMVETALPILTPEQRTIAAQKIRARATEAPKGPGL